MMANAILSELNPRQQSATVTLAQQSARRHVKSWLQRQGRKPSHLPYAEITRLADAYLASHWELYAQAALSPIVQNLRDTNRKRRPGNQGLHVCEIHVQNSTQGAGR
jgi:hypothetical protein